MTGTKGKGCVLQSGALMKAFRRSIFAWIALLGILFSQLAVAAYACPLMAGPMSDAPASEQVADDMAGMPCEGLTVDASIELDADQPGLCVQHCGQGSQSVDTSPPVALHPALVLAFVLPVPVLSDSAGDRYARPPGLAQLAEPPPFLRTGRLRI